jgi:hypothetical protein
MRRKDDNQSVETKKGRQRRLAVVAAVAAAAAAIAVPALFLGGDGSGPGTGAGTTGPTTPTGQAVDGTTAGPTDDSSSGERTYDLLEGVVDGAPPTVPYLERARLVRPDGTTLDLPHVYDQFAEVGDRIFAVHNDDRGDRTIDLLDPAGMPVESSSIDASFAVNAQGNLVAWATPQGELETWCPAGGVSLGSQAGPVTVAAVTGEGPCTPDGGSCRVYVNNVDERPPQAVAPDGTVTGVAPGALKVHDVSPRGLAAVLLSAEGMESCSGVYDMEAGHFLWRTCDHSLLRFSPGGTHLLATDPYPDGLGLGLLTVLETQTGDPVATFTIRGGFIAQQGWEDDTRPLVVISGPDGWELLRLGLDGTRERVAGPVDRAEDPTFKLLALPGNV